MDGSLLYNVFICGLAGAFIGAIIGIPALIRGRKKERYSNDPNAFHQNADGGYTCPVCGMTNDKMDRCERCYYIPPALRNVEARPRPSAPPAVPARVKDTPPPAPVAPVKDTPARPSNHASDEATSQPAASTPPKHSADKNTFLKDPEYNTAVRKFFAAATPVSFDVDNLSQTPPISEKERQDRVNKLVDYIINADIPREIAHLAEAIVSFVYLSIPKYHPFCTSKYTELDAICFFGEFVMEYISQTETNMHHFNKPQFGEAKKITLRYIKHIVSDVYQLTPQEIEAFSSRQNIFSGLKEFPNSGTRIPILTLMFDRLLSHDLLSEDFSSLTQSDLNQECMWFVLLAKDLYEILIKERDEEIRNYYNYVLGHPGLVTCD